MSETYTQREARFAKWRMQRDQRAMNEMLDGRAALPRRQADRQVCPTTKTFSPTVKLTDSSGEGKSRRSRLDSRDAATDTGHAPASPENSIDGQLQS